MKSIKYIWVLCHQCNIPKLIPRSSHKETKKFFCNCKCHNIWKSQPLHIQYGEEKAKKIKENISKPGELNPNYGKKWSDEKKMKQSILVKERMSQMSVEDRKSKMGKSNRGLKRSKEFIDNWLSTRRAPDYKIPKMSNETKKKIGDKSRKNRDDPTFQINIVRKGLLTKEKTEQY